MNLFEFNKNRFEVEFSPEVLLLKPFKAIIDSDKSKNKEQAYKEIVFIYFFTDIRSDYMYITEDEERQKEIVKDLGLPDKWKMNKLLLEAVEFYKNRSKTVNASLYEAACHSAIEISQYLKNTKKLLEERTDKGAAVTNINSITGALSKVPSIMKDLSAAHQELVKEQKTLEGRSKGNREFNMFEDGFVNKDE